MSWQAAQWALTEAPMTKSDPAGRLVLALLGEKADKAGRRAYPQALSIAHALDLNPETVKRALKRLQGYGLISKDGIADNGAVIWKLHLDKVRAAESYEEFAAQHRAAETAKKSRYRNGSAVHDRQSGTVHDDESGTEPDVHDDESFCPRLRVVPSTTMSRSVHDANDPHNRPTNHPHNRPSNHHSPSARESATDAAENELELGIQAPQGNTQRDKTRSGYTEAFEAAWVAYGRKGAKKTAYAEWQRAIKRADIATITAAIGPYVASTPEIKYRKDLERWLKGDCWESAVVPARQAVGGWQPYRDPTDQSVYDEDF